MSILLKKMLIFLRQKNDLHIKMQTVKYTFAEKTSDLLAESENLLGKLFLIGGDCEDEALLLNVILAELVNLLEELAKLAVITGTDSQRCVNKNVRNIVVTCTDAAKETEECVITAYLVMIRVDKTRAIIYIICELGLLFNANNVAV